MAQERNVILSEAYGTLLAIDAVAEPVLSWLKESTLWATSSTLVTSINKHQKLAAWCLIATGITIILTCAFARRYGLFGVAASLLVSEFVMNLYVLAEAHRLSHDTVPNFLASLIHCPPSRRPVCLSWPGIRGSSLKDDSRGLSRTRETIATVNN